MFISIAAKSSEKIVLWLKNILQDSFGKFPNNAEITQSVVMGQELLQPFCSCGTKTTKKRMRRMLILLLTSRSFWNKYSSVWTGYKAMRITKFPQYIRPCEFPLNSKNEKIRIKIAVDFPLQKKFSIWPDIKNAIGLHTTQGVLLLWLLWIHLFICQSFFTDVWLIFYEYIFLMVASCRQGV